MKEGIIIDSQTGNPLRAYRDIPFEVSEELGQSLLAQTGMYEVATLVTKNEEVHEPVRDERTVD